MPTVRERKEERREGEEKKKERGGRTMTNLLLGRFNRERRGEKKTKKKLVLDAANGA